MVIVHWTPKAQGLVDALLGASTRSPALGPAVICLFQGGLPPSHADNARVRFVRASPVNENLDALTETFRDIGIERARSIVVLPAVHVPESDAHSRVTCLAITRACEGKRQPNILVEVEDPDAAYEFAGVGVSTVFHSGYLRAALFAHACVDLGVFQFVYGLLQGRHRVRLIDVPPSLRSQTFGVAAQTMETDERGHPIILIGVQVADDNRLVINPGPRHRLDSVLGFLTLGGP